MKRVRCAVTLIALLGSGSIASAQAPGPADPYAPDPVLNEQIAEQLVTRAQELLDAKIYVDAKQLAVEALVKSPKGPAADRARHIIKVVNQYLNIKEDPPPTPPSEVKPGDQVDMTPIDPSVGRPFDPAKDPPPTTTVEPEIRDGRTAGMVHGAIYGGILGATIGAFIKEDNPASVAVPLGIATGIGAGLVSRPIVKKLGWDEAQIRTAGSLNFWGGVIGGMMGDAVTGADEGTPTARGILLGASLGATGGLLVGGAMAKNQKLTRGDVALVDTMAGIGAVGGLTLGMLMQPVQPEAYAVNSLLGAAGGIAVGVIAAPNTNTTPRRMLRVAGLAAAGGAVPFLLYAAIHDENDDSDERTVGALSSLGLVAGAYIGFRITKGMDAGLDVHDRKQKTEDAPPSLVSRDSSGAWSFGGLALQPLSPKLASDQRGATLTLVGGAF